jgi:hypothetical protein
MTEMSYPIHMTALVSRQFLMDILTTALEGGIGYWSQVGYEREEDMDTLNVVQIGPFYDAEDPKVLLSADLVGVGTIADALQAMVDPNNSRISDWLRSVLLTAISTDDAGDIDTDLADVIVQYAVFEEVRYG